MSKDKESKNEIEFEDIQNVFSISECTEVLTEEEIESLRNEIKKLQN